MSRTIRHDFDGKKIGQKWTHWKKQNLSLGKLRYERERPHKSYKLIRREIEKDCAEGEV